MLVNFAGDKPLGEIANIDDKTQELKQFKQFNEQAKINNMNILASHRINKPVSDAQQILNKCLLD